MNISNIRNAYSAYYESYQLTKATLDLSVSDSKQKLAELHAKAEEQYRKLKKDVDDWVRAHPEKAQQMNQILSNTRILRHRQKEVERGLYPLSGRSFLELAGETGKIQLELNDLVKKLDEPIEFLSGCEKAWVKELDEMDHNQAESTRLLSIKLRSDYVSGGGSNRNKTDETLQKLDLEYKSSKPRADLVRDIRNLRNYKKKAQEASHKLKIRLAEVTVIDTDAEPHALNKLERLRVKIFRFDALFMDQFR